MFEVPAKKISARSADPFPRKRGKTSVFALKNSFREKRKIQNLVLFFCLSHVPILLIVPKVT